MVDPLLNKWDLPIMFEKKQVKIRFSNTEDFLCICNLPENVTDEKFRTLVEKFGAIERSFLIYDNLTDCHKGYGLVQYCSRAVACQAKNLLHQNLFDSHTLYCDWLDHKVVTYSGLYSKCLYVESLPMHFRDLGLLRELFSKISKPMYCQIGTRTGQKGTFALVEYGSHSSADQTKEQMNGFQINHSRIRIYFCVPGRNAAQLYNNFVMEAFEEARKSNGLLPIPQVPLLPLPGIATLAMPLRKGNRRNTVSHSAGNNFQNAPVFQHHIPNVLHVPSLPNLPLIQALDRSMRIQLPFQSLVNSQQSLIAQMYSRASAMTRNLSCSRKTVYPTTMQNGRNMLNFNFANDNHIQKGNMTNFVQSSSNEKENLGRSTAVASEELSHLDFSKSQDIDSQKSESNALLETPVKQTFAPTWNSKRSPLLSLSQANDSPLLKSPPDATSKTNTAFRATVERPTIGRALLPLPGRRPRVVDRWKTAVNNPPSSLQGNTANEGSATKRKIHHLLPTPEASPQNGFVGQHSQGIGGHYADSYSKKFRATRF